MKIVWTDFAIENLKDVFDYYSVRANKKIAHKILNQILKSTKQLEGNPELGQLEFHLERLKQNHRYLVCGNYKVIYRILENQIIIIDIFDTRQNPKKITRNK
jgi:toxin ParE1/3/4